MHHVEAVENVERFLVFAAVLVKFPLYIEQGFVVWSYGKCLVEKILHIFGHPPVDTCLYGELEHGKILRELLYPLVKGCNSQLVFA